MVPFFRRPCSLKRCAVCMTCMLPSVILERDCALTAPLNNKLRTNPDQWFVLLGMTIRALYGSAAMLAESIQVFEPLTSCHLPYAV